MKPNPGIVILLAIVFVAGFVATHLGQNRLTTSTLAATPAPTVTPAPLVAPAPAAVRPARLPPGEPLLPGFSGTASWRNLGTGTPAAAFETHCWAIEHGDTDVLLSTVNLTAASRAKLKAIFDRLPASAQASYGSPERLLGTLWVYKPLPFPAFMIQAESTHSPTKIGVLLQLQYGQTAADREFVFTHESDGWRKVTLDSQVDDILAHTDISPTAHR